MTARLLLPTQLPDTIKKLLLHHQNPGAVDVYECKTNDDFLDMAEKFPLEITSLASRNTAKQITGYFMVGIALPTSADEFKHAILVYYYLNDSDWRLFKDEIQKEAAHRRQLLNETRAGWKNL
jgi:hypothetical protein